MCTFALDAWSCVPGVARSRDRARTLLASVFSAARGRRNLSPSHGMACSSVAVMATLLEAMWRMVLMYKFGPCFVKFMSPPPPELPGSAAAALQSVVPRNM